MATLPGSTAAGAHPIRRTGIADWKTHDHERFDSEKTKLVEAKGHPDGRHAAGDDISDLERDSDIRLKPHSDIDGLL
ncbi:hypothetical protein O181_022699 [Austropuccinia psidii MF-1]|uniref:Uncharacterized protein n=1 Tax=Austropuccinia psidii MF-1 TaxID=1389203 RepID=A0A9Q3CD33_9BASI|nr:hypothetical protein [Austropuccinia psidii MF-1]